MRTRKNKPQSEPFPKQVGNEAPEPPGFLRLKIPLRDDGSPDLSQWDIRDSRKQRVRDLIQNPEFLQKLGSERSASARSVSGDQASVDTGATAPTRIPDAVAPDYVLTGADVSWIFDVYSALCTLAFTSALKAPWDTVWPIVKFDDDQKQAMSEPLSKIVMKYIPPEWLLYAPEFQLCVMLAGATASKFEEAKRVVAAQQQNKDKKKEPVSIATGTTTAAN